MHTHRHTYLIANTISKDGDGGAAAAAIEEEAQRTDAGKRN